MVVVTNVASINITTLFDDMYYNILSHKVFCDLDHFVQIGQPKKEVMDDFCGTYFYFIFLLIIRCKISYILKLIYFDSFETNREVDKRI